MVYDLILFLEPDVQWILDGEIMSGFDAEPKYTKEDLGKKITKITGTRSYCTILFDNGFSLKCKGELTLDDFVIYANYLSLTDEGIEYLKILIDENNKKSSNSFKVEILM